MNEQVVYLNESPHTSEAYYASVYFSANTLIIPYINFGFLDDPVNPRSDRALYADFAYVVAQDLAFLSVQTRTIFGKCDDIDSILYLGGLQLDDGPALVDFQVCCRNSYVQLLTDSRLSHSAWIAVDSPSRNLDADAVSAFFRGDRMPLSIRSLMTH